MEKYLNTTMCSPNKSDIKTHYTCFTIQELVFIIKAYNNYYITDKIHYKKNDTRYILWYKIYNKLKKICSSEDCWTSLDFLKKVKTNTKNGHKLYKSLFYMTFKPNIAKYSKLRTIDIENVMNQYNPLFPDFYFIGAVPCDFYNYEIINIQDIIKKNRYIGVIFNTDPATSSGQHWTSCFIDTNIKSVYYFDSVGKYPNKCIQIFLNKFNYKLIINTKQHQYKNIECGIYSLFFILYSLLKTRQETHLKLPDNIVTDNQMTHFRKYLFNEI